MAFVAILSRDPALRGHSWVTEPSAGMVSTRVPGRLLRLVRERPVTSVVVDSAVFADAWEPELVVREMGRRFPSVGVILLARPETSPYTLVSLGRVGLDVRSPLGVLRLSELRHGLERALARVERGGTRARVLRALGATLRTRERSVVAAALGGVLLGWGAEDLAADAGWTRPHLSERLRAAGLPSAGALLLWARMMHAARWLSEPGRTAESVSRQLAYANGATFRRALRNVLGMTPTALVAAGGLAVALRGFLDVCDLDDSLRDHRSVA
jgi:AraC-like DNA-binding protein